MCKTTITTRPNHDPDGRTLASIPESIVYSKSCESSSSICAKLVTVREGRKEGKYIALRYSSNFLVNQFFIAVVLSISKPVTVGRDPERWYGTAIIPCLF